MKEKIKIVDSMSEWATRVISAFSNQVTLVGVELRDEEMGIGDSVAFIAASARTKRELL